VGYFVGEDREARLALQDRQRDADRLRGFCPRPVGREVPSRRDLVGDRVVAVAQGVERLELLGGRERGQRDEVEHDSRPSNQTTLRPKQLST
jgi:hypothetical protein